MTQAVCINLAERFGVRFHADDLPAVLAILRPYRRRLVTEIERARLATVGAAALARRRTRINDQSDFPAPGSTQAEPDGGNQGRAPV